MPDSSTTRGLCCSHCGSSEIYPAPGPIGALTGVLGLLRYRCRACRRAFWLRLGRRGAAAPGGAPGPEEAPAPALEAPERPGPASLEGLDAVAGKPAQPESPDADLSPLDDAIAELQSPPPPKRRRHGNRGR